MKVKQVMTKKITFIHARNTIEDAAKKMKEAGVGNLPVLHNDKAVGFITDRDITIRVVADGLDPKKVTVHRVMSDTIYACREEDKVEQAARFMAENKVRRLAVVDDDKKLTGIISLNTIAARADKKLAGDVLRRYSSG